MERKRRRTLILGLYPPKLKRHQQFKARLFKLLGYFKLKSLYGSSKIAPFCLNSLNNYDSLSLSFAL